MPACLFRIGTSIQSLQGRRASPQHTCSGSRCSSRGWQWRAWGARSQWSSRCSRSAHTGEHLQLRRSFDAKAGQRHRVNPAIGRPVCTRCLLPHECGQVWQARGWHGCSQRTSRHLRRGRLGCRQPRRGQGALQPHEHIPHVRAVAKGPCARRKRRKHQGEDPFLVQVRPIQRRGYGLLLKLLQRSQHPQQIPNSLDPAVPVGKARKGARQGYCRLLPQGFWND